MQSAWRYVGALILGLVFSGFVQAEILGVLSGEQEVEGRRIPVGSFEHIYHFSVSQPGTLSFEVDKREKITGLSLFVHGPTDHGWIALSNKAGPFSLLAGDNGYFFKVKGSSTHAKDSRYRLELNVIASAPPAPMPPVPEPAEWSMLIAGFLVIGFIVRRRNRHFRA